MTTRKRKPYDMHTAQQVLREINRQLRIWRPHANRIGSNYTFGGVAALNDMRDWVLAAIRRAKKVGERK